MLKLIQQPFTIFASGSLCTIEGGLSCATIRWTLIWSILIGIVLIAVMVFGVLSYRSKRQGQRNLAYLKLLYGSIGLLIIFTFGMTLTLYKTHKDWDAHIQQYGECIKNMEYGRNSCEY